MRFSTYKMTKIYLFLLIVLIATQACKKTLQATASAQAESMEPPRLLAQASTWPRTIEEISTPKEFVRIEVNSNSFAAWLRARSLLERDAKLMLYNGKPKANQSVHAAILNIDVGHEDLQQCADAIIRLRAEYLFEKEDFESIAFHFTSGHIAKFTQWAEGYRPQISSGSNVTWTKIASYDNSYANFRRYLNAVFRYAGTASLVRELKPVAVHQMQIGDVFIQGGFPGHAMIVVDMAEHLATKQRVFLLAQSYMPAQQIHIVKNLNSSELSPWYNVKDVEPILRTPEWTFSKQNLRRF